MNWERTHCQWWWWCFAAPSESVRCRESSGGASELIRTKFELNSNTTHSEMQGGCRFDRARARHRQAVKWVVLNWPGIALCSEETPHLRQSVCIQMKWNGMDKTCGMDGSGERDWQTIRLITFEETEIEINQVDRTHSIGGGVRWGGEAMMRLQTLLTFRPKSECNCLLRKWIESSRWIQSSFIQVHGEQVFAVKEQRALDQRLWQVIR